MAYGTETIPKVDKIIGPGNKYVNAAKKLVCGETGIDLLAGPSELVVLCDDTGNSSFIAADINAQMEHGQGLAFLFTTSERVGNEVSGQVKKGWRIKIKDLQEGVKLVNLVAPEHLEIIAAGARKIADKVTAGAVFIGNYTPCALGDYFAGPSHVLPTGGNAAFSSGLSVFDFLRTYAVMEGKREFFTRYGHFAEALAEKEHLFYHKQSLALRRTGKKIL